MEKTLLQLRLTDSRTIEKLKQENLLTKDYFVYTPSGSNDVITLPPYIWDSIHKDSFPSTEFTPLVSDLIFEFFRPSQWHVEEDIPEQRQLRKQIQADVPEKMTSIKAGYRIVSQGDRITARHLAMLQSMKSALGQSRNLWHPSTMLGTLILTLLFFGIFFIYFQISQPLLLKSNRKLFLIVTIIILTLAIAKFTEIFLLKSNNNLIESVRYPLFVPLAAILICSLINPVVASFVTGFLVVILATSLSFEWEGFLLFNLIASFIAILSIHNQRKRKEIFVVCFKAWLGCIATILALHLYHNTFFHISTLEDILSAAFFMVLTPIYVVGLLPLLESGFRVMTDVSLMEYMDPEHRIVTPINYRSARDLSTFGCRGKSFRSRSYWPLGQWAILSCRYSLSRRRQNSYLPIFH